MASNNCARCGRFAGKGHVCVPVTVRSPAPVPAPVRGTADATAAGVSVDSRVEAARAHLASGGASGLTSVADRQEIVREIHAFQDDMRPVSDDDEAFDKHGGYGMLAALWGRVPGRENVDYPTPGFPDSMFDETDENRDSWELTEQAGVLDSVWDGVGRLVRERGAGAVAETLAATARDDHWAWYASVRWHDAVSTYGPHPEGFRIVDDPSNPGRFVVTDR